MRRPIRAIRLADRRTGLHSVARAIRAPIDRSRLAARGQMLVLFVLSIFVLTGITALVVDVSWYWANTLRVQRAADAAALAGVVWLPGDSTSAYSTARAEATKNGYSAGGGVTVTPIKDPDGTGNNRRLGVSVSAPVGTFFMKIFGIPTIQATRVAARMPTARTARPARPTTTGCFSRATFPEGCTGSTSTRPLMPVTPTSVPRTSSRSGWDRPAESPGSTVGAGWPPTPTSRPGLVCSTWPRSKRSTPARR